jgi:hypothetical protein
VSSRARAVVFAAAFALLSVGLAGGACGGGGDAQPPPNDAGDAGDADVDGASGDADRLSELPPCATGMGSSTSAKPAPTLPFAGPAGPVVALDGGRLFWLHPSRGLLAFDVSDVDRPVLLSRTPLAGVPIYLDVKGGVATMVTTDAYDVAGDGKPFYGTIVRRVRVGADVASARAPTIVAEAKLSRWSLQAMRLGDVLYLASRGPIFTYGGDGALVGPQDRSIDSLVLGDTAITYVDQVKYRSSRVTVVMRPEGIVTAQAVPVDVTVPDGAVLAETDVQFIDVSNTTGTLIVHGTARVKGRPHDDLFGDEAPGLTFDGRYVHAVGCTDDKCTGSTEYTLETLDFQAIDTPELTSEQPVAFVGDRPLVREEGGRLWIAQASSGKILPFDLADPAAPTAAPSIDADAVLDLHATPTRLFALARVAATGPDEVTREVEILDVSSLAAPKLLGSVALPESTMTGAESLDRLTVVDDATLAIPFVRAPSAGVAFQSGARVVSLRAGSMSAALAETKLETLSLSPAAGRLFAFGEHGLSVASLADPAAPSVAPGPVVARDVVEVASGPTRVVEIARKPWTDGMELRALPLEDAEELGGLASATPVTLEGEDPIAFRNGALAYVVHAVLTPAGCSLGATGCARTQRITVVDTSSDPPRVRGSVDLPNAPEWSGLGAHPFRRTGAGADAWCEGPPAIQVAPDLLAIRRFRAGATDYAPALHDLFVVDLANPDTPRATSLPLTRDPLGWWGNMVVLGTRLGATHVEYAVPNDRDPTTHEPVRTFLDVLDASDRAHPSVTSIRVPGVVVGAAPDDPSRYYAIDFPSAGPEVVVAQVSPARVAETLGVVAVHGPLARPLIDGTSLFATVDIASVGPRLVAFDLSKPGAPTSRLTTEGDLYGGPAVATFSGLVAMGSGYGSIGLDWHRLTSAGALDFMLVTRGAAIEAIPSFHEDRVFVALGAYGIGVVRP